MEGSDNKKKEEIAYWNDPDNLADTILTCRYMLPDNQVGYTLRFWRDEFYYYDKGKYRKVSDSEIKCLIKEYIHNLNSKFPAEGIPPIKITNHVVSNVMLCIAGMVGCRIPETVELNSWLDYIPRGQIVNFRNGLLFFDNRGENDMPILKEHDPQYFTLSQLPYDYDPKAECLRIQDFLIEIMESDFKRIELLQQWAGYLFQNNLREQKFLLCVGNGANGKGVLFELLEGLVGKENCSHIPLVCFGDQFLLVNTLGKALNSTSESSANISRYAETMLKNFTAGDRLSFQRKFRDPIEAVPTAKVMIATNQLPKFRDRTNGVWRRMLFMPFERDISESKQNHYLAEKLSKELPGLCNWAIQGLKSLKEKGFVKPEKCTDAIEIYKRRTNPARAFLQDNYRKDRTGKIQSKELYDHYKQWCENNGHRPLSNESVGLEVKRVLDVEKTRSTIDGIRNYYYSGIARIET